MLSQAKLYAQQAPIDSLYALLGLHLGSGLGALPTGFQRTGTAQHKIKYVLQKDSLMLQGLRLRRVTAYFYANQLMDVVLTTPDASASAALLTYLQQTFGTGQQLGYAPRYLWKGQRAVLQYDENLFTHTAEVTLESMLLHLKLDSALRKEVNE